MQILLIMLIVVLLAFSVLLLALAKQSPREKQTEDKEQEEYIRDYAETVRQTGGSMKKLEHWKVIAIYLIIYDMIAVNFSYFMALLVRFDFRYSSIPTDYFAAWRSFAPIYTIITLAVFGCMHTEIKITKDGPKVVELGARLGGDNITTYVYFGDCCNNCKCKASISICSLLLAVFNVLCI